MGVLAEALKEFKPREAAPKIRKGLLAVVRKSRASGIVIDASYGPYSMAVCALSALALGRGKVRAVYAIAARGDRKEAALLASALSGYKLPLQVIDASAAAEKVKRLVAAAGVRGRRDLCDYVRAAIVRYYADSSGMLVAGSATKTEVMLGWGLALPWADVLPLAGMFATQACALSEYLGLPKAKASVEPAASFGLRPAKLDEVLLGVQLGWTPEEIAKDAEVSKEAVRRVLRAVEAAKEVGERRIIYEWGPGLTPRS